MKTTAYIRVSTDKQDVDNQRLEILALANQKKLGTVTFYRRNSIRKKDLERAGAVYHRQRFCPKAISSL